MMISISPCAGRIAPWCSRPNWWSAAWRFATSSSTTTRRPGFPCSVYRRRRGDPEVRPSLSLPLLDYILRRADGELATGLDPIHQAQLDGFQARLLALDEARAHQDGEITLLRADISGAVEVYRYVLDKGTQGNQPRLVKQR